jgi:hypothetical protein
MNANKFEFTGTHAKHSPEQNINKITVQKALNTINASMEAWLIDTIRENIPEFTFPVTSYSMWMFRVRLIQEPIANGHSYKLYRDGEQIGDAFIQRNRITND